MSRIKFKVFKLTKRNTRNSKIREGWVMILCTALLLNEIYLPTKFLFNTPCHFWVMSAKTELLNKIYLPTQFEDHISRTFRVMFRTRNLQRTDRPPADSSKPPKTLFLWGIITLAKLPRNVCRLNDQMSLHDQIIVGNGTKIEQTHMIASACGSLGEVHPSISPGDSGLHWGRMISYSSLRCSLTDWNKHDTAVMEDDEIRNIVIYASCMFNKQFFW